MRTFKGGTKATSTIGKRGNFERRPANAQEGPFTTHDGKVIAHLGSEIPTKGAVFPGQRGRVSP